jgi:hypothetical protein
MKVNKKLSTIKTDFEKVVREAGLKLNISNVTPHSARKFYCNSRIPSRAASQKNK